MTLLVDYDGLELLIIYSVLSNLHKRISRPISHLEVGLGKKEVTLCHTLAVY